jgi:heme-degrading monooxygenase HmoA
MAGNNPCYYAVIFSSRRNSNDNAGYGQAAARMLELAALQPGFLGVESVRGANGEGITVSYWADRESITAWRNQEEHAAIRLLGRERWYESFQLRICRVEDEYGFPAIQPCRDFPYI